MNEPESRIGNVLERIHDNFCLDVVYDKIEFYLNFDIVLFEFDDVNHVDFAVDIDECNKHNDVAEDIQHDSCKNNI
jgi:hypothetical protein